MMKYYFLDGAFYIDGLNNHIPDNAIEISSDEYHRLFDGQANGKIISAGNDGHPVLQEPIGMTREEEVARGEQKKQSLIDSAMQSISVLQMKLLAGRMLTDAETTRLNAVLDYIDAVQVIDTSTAPDINWPDFPVV